MLRVAFMLYAIDYDAEPGATADGGLAAQPRGTAKAPSQLGPISTHQGHKVLSGIKILKEA